MNDENLTPFNELDPEEHRRLSSKGGKASSRMAAGRRLLRDELEGLLSEPGRQVRICDALIKKAEGGDTKAFRTIAEVLGENAAFRLEVSRGDQAERERFIENNAEGLIALMKTELETGDDAVSRQLGLTYQERKQLLEYSVLKDIESR